MAFLFLEKRVDEFGNIIAFHAKTGPHQQNLNINQTFLFHDVTQNIGNGYNSNSGIFICPMEGLYSFSMTILSFRLKTIETELVLNGQNILRVYSGSSDANVYNAGTNTVLVKLNLGDQIWPRVYNNPGQNHDNIAIHGYGWSTLTGVLVKQF